MRIGPDSDSSQLPPGASRFQHNRVSDIFHLEGLEADLSGLVGRVVIDGLKSNLRVVRTWFESIVMDRREEQLDMGISQFCVSMICTIYDGIVSMLRRK